MVCCFQKADLADTYMQSAETVMRLNFLASRFLKQRCSLISGLLASVTGIMLSARMYSALPTVGQGFEMDAIAAVVLGGTSFTGGSGSIGGTMIGVLIIGVLNNGMNLLQIPFYYQLLLKGVVIVFAVYLDTMKKRKAGV